MANEGMNQADQNQLSNNQSRKNNSSEFAADMTIKQTNSQKKNQKGRIEGPVSERTAWH